MNKLRFYLLFVSQRSFGWTFSSLQSTTFLLSERSRWSRWSWWSWWSQWSRWSQWSSYFPVLFELITQVHTELFGLIFKCCRTSSDDWNLMRNEAPVFTAVPHVGIICLQKCKRSPPASTFPKCRGLCCYPVITCLNLSLRVWRDWLHLHTLLNICLLIRAIFLQCFQVGVIYSN